MRALVAGCGSIGRRHAAACLSRSDVERVVVATSWDGCADALPPDPRLSVTSLDEALTCATADFAIVATDTDRHLEVAVPLVERGIDTLVEKPISHDRDGIEDLVRAARATGATVCVGYNLRFLPAVQRLRSIIAEKLGGWWSARFEAGQWLGDWRSGRDYRDTYSAHRDRGGGVALDLSHELDAMRFLVGDPARQWVRSARVSTLEIDSDDLFEGLYEYPSGAVATVHLDYLASKRVRAYSVLGPRGRVTCDIAAGRLSALIDGIERVEDDPALFDVSATYAAQLDAFIAARRGETTSIASLADGVRVLELVEGARDA